MLTSIGNEVSKVARKRVDDFIPLARLLWDSYGREGRVVATILLGTMELADPETVIPLLDFLARHVPPEDPAATWVLCDALRSMTGKFLPEFALLLPLYEQWASDPALSARDRRSVESAVKALRSVQR